LEEFALVPHINLAALTSAGDHVVDLNFPIDFDKPSTYSVPVFGLPDFLSNSNSNHVM